MMELVPADFQCFPGETHRGREVILIHFPKDDRLIRMLRQHTPARWSATRKCWYVPDNKHYRALFRLPQKSIGKNALAKIHPVNRPAFERYREGLQLRGYSPNTQRTYCLEFAQLLYILKAFPVTQLTEDRLRSYCLYCIRKCKLSENQMHSRLNALKFYFEKVLHRDKFFAEIPRPKKPALLPKALSREEITQMLRRTENLKHRLLLKLCYGMGLRVSEVVNLKIAHIDSTTMKVLIARGKGKKDRYVNLPASVLKELRAYYLKYEPKVYLFEGAYGAQYSVRSVQAVFKQAMQRAGIHKNVGIHCLRHSYATHLLQQGTDISLIQKLLGHNQIKTTLIYTAVTDKNLAGVKSPLDRL